MTDVHTPVPDREETAATSSLDARLTAKLDSLRRFIGGYESAVIAYSGGVDSALVMAVSHQILGASAIACIGVSPSYPDRERHAAIALAERLGSSYRLVPTDEMTNSNYAANPDNRCYFCKHALHEQLMRVASTEGQDVVFDGTNADDARRAKVDRPGIQAAQEFGVRSPLVEAELGKDEVRAIARHLGLSVWDKPATACLASRVAHGDQITAALLERIERAEDVLVDLGLHQFRVRVHREVTRIEVPIENLAEVLALRDEIMTRFEALNHQFVTLDLAGFRSGSMNATRMDHRVVTDDDDE